MVKTYTKTYGIPLFLLLLAIMVFIFTPFMFIDKTFILFTITLISGIGLLLVIPATVTEKIVLTDTAIIKSWKYPHRTYEIQYDEISQIIDDDISTWPFKLHVFHLIPKSGIRKNFKRFTIHEGIQNRKELISEILSRVGPEVYVEDGVYQYIGKGPSKTETK